MKVNPGIIGAVLIGGAALLAIGYGRLGGETTPPAAAHEKAAPAPSAKAQPASPHAVKAADKKPAAAPEQDQPQPREGKVTVDRSAAFTHFRVGNRNVKSIYTEGSVVWVGTSGGIVRYDTNTEDYKLYDNKNGLLSNGVFWVGKIKGQIAAGTYGGGLSLLDEAKGTWETFNVPEGLGDAFVYEVMETKQGDLWIATWSGANRIRGGELRERGKWDLFTVENTGGGLPNDWVYGLAEGKNGEIWLATEGGLARFHKGKWDNWNHAKGQGAPYEKVKNDIAYNVDPAQVSTHHARQKEEMGLQNVSVAYNPNYIVAMKVDAQGVVWVGTWGGGLGRFDGRTWKNYTTAEGLPGNHVFMLHIDRRGQLWFGTNNGVGRMLSGRFEKPMTMKDGLFANTVFSMTTGSDGSMWIGSYGGVARIRKPPGK